MSKIYILNSCKSWVLIIAGVSALAAGSTSKAAPSTAFSQIVEQAKKTEIKLLKSGPLGYRLAVHAPEVAKGLKGEYTFQDLDRLQNQLGSSLNIKVNEKGLVQAADRELGGKKDDTNYDAIWVRDSLWVYLSLNRSEHHRPQAEQVLNRMLDYFSTPAQLTRMRNVIKNPSLVTAKNGEMEVIHIRFDGRSDSMDDVRVGGQPQRWNHKQNDALGLFYDLTLRALAANEIDPKGLKDNHWEALTNFPCYFDKIRFYEMEDAGPWEEIDRTNSSSIGLVTSSLEQLQSILENKKLPLRQTLLEKSKTFKSAACLSATEVSRLLRLGYRRIHEQLAAGGESPLYDWQSPKYRRADAALFNLIYPARLKELSLAEKLKILAINEVLTGPVGIKRYLFDSYQSGNFWIKPEDGTSAGGSTDDTSSESAFASRGQSYIAGTEAQWFFDSWLSVVYGLLYKETHENKYYFAQVQYLNRALGQATGGTPNSKFLGADGQLVPPLAFPESYNSLINRDQLVLAPSPITPLNWAKGSLTLAFMQLRETLAERNLRR